MRAWCNTCRAETLHDKRRGFGQDDYRDTAEIAFVSLFTFGLAAALTPKLAVCQCCGTARKR